jgi:hypothetical protein
LGFLGWGVVEWDGGIGGVGLFYRWSIACGDGRFAVYAALLACCRVGGYCRSALSVLGGRFVGLCCLWMTTEDRGVKIISYEESRMGKGGGDGLRKKFAALGAIDLLHWPSSSALWLPSSCSSSSRHFVSSPSLGAQ